MKLGVSLIEENVSDEDNAGDAKGNDPEPRKPARRPSVDVDSMIRRFGPAR
jgi:hypothetical protein